MLLVGREIRRRLSKAAPGYTKEAYIDAVNETYSQLADSRSWGALEKSFTIITKPYVNSVGAHFTNGATTVTAATCADWSRGITGGFEGMFIKKSEEAAYYILTTSTTTIVTMAEAYGGVTTTPAVTAGEGYYIFQHLYAVDSTIETVTHLMGDRYLREIDEAQLEIKDADIDEEGEPLRWRNAGYDSAGQSVLEIFPRLIDDVYELRGKGKRRVETIDDSTRPLLDGYLIVAYATVDLLKRKQVITPDTITGEMIERAEAHANDLLQVAISSDNRKSKGGRYTHDTLFGTRHRGQDWLVSHDPWDA